jgi:hypothetical protein
MIMKDNTLWDEYGSKLEYGHRRRLGGAMRKGFVPYVTYKKRGVTY